MPWPLLTSPRSRWWLPSRSARFRSATPRRCCGADRRGAVPSRFLEGSVPALQTLTGHRAAGALISHILFRVSASGFSQVLQLRFGSRVKLVVPFGIAFVVAVSVSASVSPRLQAQQAAAQPEVTFTK